MEHIVHILPNPGEAGGGPRSSRARMPVCMRPACAQRAGRRTGRPARQEGLVRRLLFFKKLRPHPGAVAGFFSYAKDYALKTVAHVQFQARSQTIPIGNVTHNGNRLPARIYGINRARHRLLDCSEKHFLSARFRNKYAQIQPNRSKTYPKYSCGSGPWREIAAKAFLRP